MTKRDRTSYFKDYYSRPEVIERKKLRNKKYYSENKTKIWKCPSNTTENNLYRSAKTRASSKNIIFDLELSDIIIPETCPYLEIPLTKIKGKGRIKSNASLDRIDSSQGYTKNNIEIISELANRMKNNASKEELIAFAKGILKKYDK